MPRPVLPTQMFQALFKITVFQDFFFYASRVNNDDQRTLSNNVADG